jgi:hypothetical protein
MTAPCENCKIRHPRCHSSCETYAAFRKAKDAEIAARAKAHDADELNLLSIMRNTGKKFAR